ncbi:hypothetical protein [Rugamonas rivuli]|uniref:Uncharacterized protein n=1 Tax=Rugamonas rivuli TaxID=2743358 RepID=A0A843SH65_9BURK|nr:hypothetical protein [Rugamonas rivuli]MQA23639.1 hypothetical protein [Rugamonas rivuli]
MNAITIASVPAEMAGFPVIKNAMAVFDNKYNSQLKEWLECQDFMLGMKAISMGGKEFRNESLRNLQGIIAKINSGQPIENETVRIGLLSYLAESKKPHAVAAEVASFVEQVTLPVLDQLNETALKDKRHVLGYAQIIPAAIAAAFLGLSEKNLTGWQQCWSIFGKSYAGAHCYSLKELQMIAENRGQIYTGLVADDVRAVATVADTALDEVVMVEEEVAAAFANMSRKEISTQLPRNALMRRPYRLSDLEKIRVSKLNGTN